MSEPLPVAVAVPAEVLSVFTTAKATRVAVSEERHDFTKLIDSQ